MLSTYANTCLGTAVLPNTYTYTTNCTYTGASSPSPIETCASRSDNTIQSILEA